MSTSSISHFSDQSLSQMMGIINLECQVFGVDKNNVFSEIATKLGANIEENAMHVFMPSRDKVDFQKNNGQAYIPALPQINYRAIPSSRTYQQHDEASVLAGFNYLFPNKLSFKNTRTHIDDLAQSMNCSKNVLENTLNTMREREVWTLDRNIENINLLDKAKGIFEAVIENIIENNAEQNFATFLQLHPDNTGYFLLFIAYLPIDDFLFLTNYLYAYDAHSTIKMMEVAMDCYVNYLSRAEKLRGKKESSFTTQDKTELQRVITFMNVIVSYFERMHFLNQCFIKETVYSRENMQRVLEIINSIQIKNSN